MRTGKLKREKGREEFYQLVNKYVPPYFLKKKKKTRVFSLILNEFVVTCILEICLAEDLRKITIDAGAEVRVKKESVEE